MLLKATIGLAKRQNLSMKTANTAVLNQIMKISSVKKMLLAFGVAGLCAAGNLQAAEIQGVTISSFSGQTNTTLSSSIYSVTNLVSSTGLFGDYHCFAAGGSMWLSAAGLDATNYVTFNLGGTYMLSGVKVWNYNDSSHLNYGVSNASISYSLDGVNFTTAISSTNLNEGPGGFEAYAQTIWLPSSVTAQYVRINVNTNWGGGTAGVGLAKVRFISDTNRPTVLSASENFGSNQVTVVFSEPVDAVSATTTANYSVSGATISSVNMGEYADRVILHTSPLSGNNYSVSVSGVYDEALTASVANNSTVPVQSELYLWLRADQGVTTTPAFGGNMLTAWNDQSSYSHNAGPASFFGVLTNQPFLAPSVVNGLPAVQFFGTNVMQIPNDAANPINGDMTLFMVVSSTSSGSAEDPINKTGGATTATTSNNVAAPFDFYLDTTAGGGKPVFYFGNNGVVGNKLTGTGTHTNVFYVVAVSVTATNLCQVIFNGNSPIKCVGASPTNLVTGAYGEMNSAPWDGGNPICIGARNSGGSTLANAQPFIGYLPEVMLIRGTITPGDFTSIENYLAAKYAIAPPYINEEPASVTANAGSQAIFWVNASGGMPFSYQWQSNGVPIAGATNLSYTTPYLTSSANGASYTVTISNAAGATNSSAATLTVVTPTTPPTVFSATRSAGLTNVLVIFSEAIDPVTGLNAANYSIDGGVSILSIAAGNSPNQVVLTTSPMSPNGFANAFYNLKIQNVQDQYNNAIVPANVPIMPNGLVMWLRSDSGIVTNASASSPSAVDAWLDQTANGNNAETYTVPAGFRPNMGTESANSLPALVFNRASENYLVAPSSPSLALTGDMTVVFVADFSEYSFYHEVIAKEDLTGHANSWEINMQTGGSGRLRWNRGDGTSQHTQAFIAGGAQPPTGQPVVWDAYQQGIANGTGGTSYYYLNGTSVGSNPWPAPYTYADFGSQVMIGSRNSLEASTMMDGNIAAIMVFSNAISGADRTNLDNYLGQKYFPFSVVANLPAAVTSSNGYTYTYTFSTASQGSLHPNYQWQEDGTNIPGATGVNYTTPILGPTYSNSTWDVVETFPDETTYTSVVSTLTVLPAPPVVTSAGIPLWEATSPSNIVVLFNVQISSATANVAANYTLNSGSVLSAAMGVESNKVILTTTPLAAWNANPGTYLLTVQNVQDLYGDTIVPVQTPVAIYPARTAVWLKASTGTSSDGGGGIGQWNDQSGLANNFTSPYGVGFDPILATNASGYPVVRFNGATIEVLTAANTVSLQFTNEMSIFTVVNFATLAGGTNGEIISETANNAFACPFDYYVQPQGANLVLGNGVTTAPGVFSSGAPSVGVTHVLDAVWKETQETYRLDAQPNGGGTIFANTLEAGQPIHIGTRGDGNNHLTGDLNELIVIGSAVPAEDLASIEGYLATEYNIQVVNTSPTNIVFSAAQNQLTLSWPSDHLGWQLQAQTNSVSTGLGTNWVNVTGSTTTTQVVIPINPANGTVFYRLVYP